MSLTWGQGSGWTFDVECSMFLFKIWSAAANGIPCDAAFLWRARKRCRASLVTAPNCMRRTLSRILCFDNAALNRGAAGFLTVGNIQALINCFQMRLYAGVADTQCNADFLVGQALDEEA